MSSFCASARSLASSPVGLAFVGLWVYAACMASCSLTHDASITFVCSEADTVCVYVRRIEQDGCDSQLLILSSSGCSVRYEAGLRHPELLEVRGVDGAQSIMLLEPGEHLIVDLSKEGATGGSGQMSRLAAFQFQMGQLRDSIGRLAAAYPTTSRGGVYDSLRRATLAAYDSLLAHGRRIALRFIEAEPYSKAAMVALLAEYDRGMPLFPLGEYDSLYAIVLERMHQVYPPTALTALVASCYDSICCAGASLHQPQGRWQLGDTLPARLREYLSSCVVDMKPPIGGYALHAVRGDSCTAMAPLSVREGRDMANCQYVRIVADAAGRVVATCTVLGADGNVLRTYAIKDADADSILAWMGIRATPILIRADAKGIVRTVDGSAVAK